MWRSSRLHHFACSTARNKGTCSNLLTIRRDVLEVTVLDALRHRLMDPELFRVFVAEFTAEWNRLQAERRGRAGGQAQRAGRGSGGGSTGLIRAIEEGLYEPSMKARMQGLERRREALEAELATATEPKPRLHPGLAEVYRQKVATLHEALAAEDGHEVREALRALVEAIVLGAGGRQAGHRGPRRSGGDPGARSKRQYPARGPGT